MYSRTVSEAGVRVRRGIVEPPAGSSNESDRESSYRRLIVNYEAGPARTLAHVDPDGSRSVDKYVRDPGQCKQRREHARSGELRTEPIRDLEERGKTGGRRLVADGRGHRGGIVTTGGGC
jgi:hypothetical protein